MKREFPIAQIRDDKTPAIWFTHDYWLILESGIVRAYLDNREQLGREKARREQRLALLGTKHHNHRLKDMEFLDSWPHSQTNADNARRLFEIGFNAYRRHSEDIANRWTLENLIEHGNKAEQRGYLDELKLIANSQPKEEAKV
jgi:hypothetical protein